MTRMNCYDLMRDVVSDTMRHVVQNNFSISTKISIHLPTCLLPRPGPEVVLSPEVHPGRYEVNISGHALLGPARVEHGMAWPCHSVAWHCYGMAWPCYSVAWPCQSVAWPCYSVAGPWAPYGPRAHMGPGPAQGARPRFNNKARPRYNKARPRHDKARPHDKKARPRQGKARPSRAIICPAGQGQAKQAK